MGWPNIDWDDDGYPTDASIEAVEKHELDFGGASNFLRCELQRCAEVCCASYEEEEAKDILDHSVIHGAFSTGGWSGAETLIEMIERRFDTHHLMLSWRRGGHYVFEFKIPQPLTTGSNDAG